MTLMCELTKKILVQQDLQLNNFKFFAIFLHVFTKVLKNAIGFSTQKLRGTMLLQNGIQNIIGSILYVHCASTIACTCSIFINN